MALSNFKIQVNQMEKNTKEKKSKQIINVYNATIGYFFAPLDKINIYFLSGLNGYNQAIKLFSFYHQCLHQFTLVCRAIKPISCYNPCIHLEFFYNVQMYDHLIFFLAVVKLEENLLKLYI